MLRRNARLRREYLYRKGLEGKEKAEYERKRLIREALAGEREDGREERGGEGTAGGPLSRSRSLNPPARSLSPSPSLPPR